MPQKLRSTDYPDQHPIPEDRGYFYVVFYDLVGHVEVAIVLVKTDYINLHVLADRVVRYSLQPDAELTVIGQEGRVL